MGVAMAGRCGSGDVVVLRPPEPSSSGVKAPLPTPAVGRGDPPPSMVLLALPLPRTRCGEVARDPAGDTLAEPDDETVPLPLLLPAPANGRAVTAANGEGARSGCGGGDGDPRWLSGPPPVTDDGVVGRNNGKGMPPAAAPLPLRVAMGELPCAEPRDGRSLAGAATPPRSASRSRVSASFCVCSALYAASNASALSFHACATSALSPAALSDANFAVSRSRSSPAIRHRVRGCVVAQLHERTH